MKIKFNKFERVAGVFVLTAILGSLLIAVSVAIKQGWFATKIPYTAEFSNADGVHPGTTVQIQGLKAGSVDDVDLQPNNLIRVKFHVLGKYSHLLRQDSVAQFVRPFIIGERVLELTVGSEDAAPLLTNANVGSIENVDIFNLLSGKNLNTQLAKVSSMLENVSEMMNQFLNKDRTSTMVKLFDRMDPLLVHMDGMSREVTKLAKTMNATDDLPVTLKNLSSVTHELDVILPDLNKNNPKLGQDISKITQNLIYLTETFRVLGPALESVGPELPNTAMRLIEALNETVVMMKAMQRNYFLRSHVEDVRTEETKRDQSLHQQRIEEAKHREETQNQRLPAAQDEERP